MLRGNGRGDFEVAPWSQTKLVVSGEARAVAATDLNADGWPDVIVMRADQRTLGFLNRGVPGGASLRVVVSSDSTEASPVGTVVVVDRRSGGREILQVQGDTNELFFGGPESDPFVRASVTSPTGKVTNYEIAAGTRTLELSVK